MYLLKRKREDNLFRQLSCSLIILALAVIFIFPACLQGSSPILPDKAEYSPDNSISELSFILSIPASKLKEGLNLPADEDNSVPVRTLNINSDDIEKAIDYFDEQLWSYSWNIVIIGMLVIFFSLALTGFFVGQLQYFTRNRNKPVSEVKVAAKPVNQNGRKTQPDNNSLIAAIATLQIHIKEFEESDRMIVPWKRDNTSTWKSFGRIQMPNQIWDNQQ